ncbi:MAG: hypothetical protein R2856_17500 [Caldilineaceae bacterium]
MALPTAVGSVMLRPRAGAVLATLISVVAVLLARQGTASAAEAAMSLAGVWGIYLVYFAAFRSVDGLVSWSWAHYQHAQHSLDEVRRPLHLYQTMDDLAHANRQLALMNRRAAAQLAAEEAQVEGGVCGQREP